MTVRTRSAYQPASSKEEFFWARVSKSEACWLWTGKKTTTGYGQLKYAGEVGYAHRYALELALGELPAEAVVDHVCHNVSCVNPGHLRAVDDQQNKENRLGATRNSRSGVRGVYWDDRRKKWRAGVKKKNQRYFIGYFSDLAEASDAARAARARLFEVPGS